ncbi:MAG TPA: BlaI/MecI/CopY family transcriptional regulator [Solirubrobacterales bacterium]|jgi:predicted transcriptional regulator
MSGGEKRRPAGALEGEVLAALWAADGPLTPAEVRDGLGGDLAYTTVMTTLARLFEKGTVRREKAGRAFAYAPLLDEAAITAERMGRLLGSAGGREAVLARFVGSLSPEDERLLIGLLAEGRDEEPAAP